MKKLSLLALLLIIQVGFAQDFRFGKVSKEELMETAHPMFPEANAAILYKYQNVKFIYMTGSGFVQEDEVRMRIKIYNKDGFDYATKLVKIYTNSEGSSSNDEKIIGLKGVTYTLANGKIDEDKLRKDGIFEEQSNKYWKTTKFTMPNIQEGCVIEFEYTVQRQNLGIEDLELQELIPINKLDFKIKTPEYFKYKALLNPRAAYVPKLDISKDRGQVNVTSKINVGSISVPRTKFETSKLEYEIDVISAELTDIPPLIDETYVDNLSNYQTKLIMELDVIKYPNELAQPLSTTWEKVTKIIYDDQEFGAQLNKSGYYDNDLDLLLNDAKNDQQKVAVIFDHVKSKVKWNGFHGYFTDEGVNKAYKGGTGNSADINLMLISMLRYAGFDANPILISTKSNGVPLLPTRSGFNYVICGLLVGDSSILLDATLKNTTANILPIKSLNWLGRLIRKDGSSDWIDMIPKMQSKEIVALNVKLSSDLSATGKVRSQFTDYQAFRVRDKYDNFSDAQIIESLEKNKGGIVISNLENENMKDVSNPILQSYEYTYSNAMEEIGGKLYFSPMLFLTPKENPFKLDHRNYPIDYVYPIADKYMVNIMIPEGYIVETLPESVKSQFNGTDGEFTYLSKVNGSYIQFTISLDLNKTIILPTEYEQFKEFYQQMIEKETEKVVLTKV